MAASHHLEPLITDLGLILMTAGVALLLFKKIRQPVVLGYLIAGFLAGNHFDFFPSVTDMKSVEVWAEIGVIFLLFSLGLEFSFKKLVKVGGTASVTALTQILFMVFAGYGVGRLMNWSTTDSLFLGVIVSISSTTIILKSFEELRVKTQQFAGNVLGALIVQDLLAILMMVLLATVAGATFSGGMIIQSVLELIFFLTLWFLGGIFFVPTLLKRVKPLLSNEMLLIISLALCLMMVILANNVGFSPALGAFVMGSIMAETTQAEHIEHLVRPVKDLFGAVFFVSVGMLIDPQALIQYAGPVALLTVLVIVGQSVSATGGALLSGQPLRQSVQTGMSLSQIGEFSFIIATMGASMGVTGNFLYPVVVAVSAVTTFTTPFMIKWSTPFADYLQQALPRKWVKSIERYSANAQSIRSASYWQIALRAYVLQIVVHSVIIVAAVLISKEYLLPLVQDYRFGRFIGAALTLVVISPFLYALALRRVAKKEVEALFQERKYRGPIIMMILFRFILTLFYIGFLLNYFFSPAVALIALVVSVVSYLLFPKKLNAQYHRIENHFLKNLNAREIIRAKRQRSDLTPWDGHMALIDIGQDSAILGKTLEELQLREKIGINIAFIKRADIVINIPSRNERLFPGDEVCIIGTDKQVLDFQKYLEDCELHSEYVEPESDIVLQQVELKNEDFIGKSIRESKIREQTRGLVVGLERSGKRILNPDSVEILEKGDILWIVGERKLLARLVEEKSPAQAPVVSATATS